MTANNQGGFNRYRDTDQLLKRIKFRDFPPAYTIPMTLKAGNVVKQRSWLEVIMSGADTGKVQPHGGISEANVVQFVANLAAGATIIFGGLTYTAGANAVTPTQLVSDFTNGGVGIEAGATVGNLTPAYGTWSGTIAAWNIAPIKTLTSTVNWNYLAKTYTDTDSINVTAGTILSNVTDLAITGTGAASATLSTIQGATALKPIVGLTLDDVNATSADVIIPVTVCGSFYSHAITWAVNPAADFMYASDGVTPVYFTAYNTGCYSRLRQQAFVASSNFSIMGWENAGDAPSSNNQGY